MGSVFDGIAFWLPEPADRSRASRPKLTDWTVLHHILGIPLDFWYGIVIMLIMFYVLTFTPFGQRSLFVGQSREVARLSGFKVGSTRFWGFVVAGFIAAISRRHQRRRARLGHAAEPGPAAALGLRGSLPRHDDDPAGPVQRDRRRHLRLLPGGRCQRHEPARRADLCPISSSTASSSSSLWSPRA